MSMRYFRIFFCLAFGLMLSALPLSAQDDYILHTVIKGQGLYSISRMYGVTEDDIVRLNPGSDKVIRAGEQLRIPRKPTETPATYDVTTNAQIPQNAFISHTVQPGETVYRLTVTYGVSNEAIYQANPTLSTDGLKAGQVVLIPTKSDTEAVFRDDESNGTSDKKYVVKGAYGSSAQNTSSKNPDSFLNRLFGKGQQSDNVTADSIRTFPCRQEHVVQRKETLFGLARKYGITQEELIAANPELASGKMKKGQVLCIPDVQSVPTEEPEPMADVVTESVIPVPESDDSQRADDSVIHASLILPFMLNDGTVSPGADKAKMIEYYEGFLLAVDTLRSQGVSIDLHVFDSGDKDSSIQPILNKTEMANMDIIFGPMHPKHVKEATAFARDHGIRLVLPFSREPDDVMNNPSVWEVNAPQTVVEDEAITSFFRLFPSPNVLFFQTKGSSDSFATRLQQELKDRGFKYSVFAADTTSNVRPFMEVCSPTNDNVLLLTSSDNSSLSSMLPVFQLMQRDTATVAPIHLFGYPQYQTYATKHLAQLHELDTWFYSAFYSNTSFPEVAEIHRKFYHTYSREIGNRVPRYALLGYDTALWFFNTFTGLPSHPVQSGFRFEHLGSKDGQVNHKVFVIHLSTDGTTTKNDLDR